MRKQKTHRLYALIGAVSALVMLAILSNVSSPPAVGTIAQAGPPRSSSVFNYHVNFGMIPGQAVRFCVGTGTARSPAFDWTIRISGEQGDLLFQVPTTHSPASEWHCRDVPRNSLPVVGEAGTGRAELAALLTVLAPSGTSAADIVASFSVNEPDGSTAYYQATFKEVLISGQSVGGSR